MGLAIARRVSAGKHVLLADLREGERQRGRPRVLSDAGFEVSTARGRRLVSRLPSGALVASATAIGDVAGLIHAAGVSPSQASPEVILKVDLYGTALLVVRVR